MMDIVWIIIHTIYELKDMVASYVYRTNNQNGFITNNSWFNSIGDTIYALAGFIFAFYLFKLLKVNYLYIISLIMSIPVIKLLIDDINNGRY